MGTETQPNRGGPDETRQRTQLFGEQSTPVQREWASVPWAEERPRLATPISSWYFAHHTLSAVSAWGGANQRPVGPPARPRNPTQTPPQTGGSLEREPRGVSHAATKSFTWLLPGTVPEPPRARPPCPGSPRSYSGPNESAL